MVGLPLAEPATAAGGRSVSAAPATPAGTRISIVSSGLAGKLDSRVFRKALDGYQSVRHKRKPILTIIDYSKPSTMRRLFVIDVKRHKLLYHTWVSHGAIRGVWPARQFSNQMNSRQSSLGVYRTAETYQGKPRLPLRPRRPQSRQEQQCPQARHRGARGGLRQPRHLQKFDKLGAAGDAWPLPREQSRAIIDTIKGGSVIYAHG